MDCSFWGISPFWICVYRVLHCILVILLISVGYVLMGPCSFLISVTLSSLFSLMMMLEIHFFLSFIKLGFFFIDLVFMFSVSMSFALNFIIFSFFLKCVYGNLSLLYTSFTFAFSLIYIKTVILFNEKK